MEDKPLDSAKVGIRKAQKLGQSSGRYSEPCCHRWLSVGRIRQWCACGWSVVQLDQDVEMGPMRVMHDTQDAEPEVRHTIKRAELTPFLSLLKTAIGPAMVHVDNTGIIDGLWRGEMRCSGP